MAAGLLAVHQETHHGVDSGGSRKWETLPSDAEPRKYRVSFPTVVGLWECPVEGCRGRATTRMAMRVHFLHRHIRDTMVILE